MICQSVQAENPSREQSWCWLGNKILLFLNKLIPTKISTWLYIAKCQSYLWRRMPRSHDVLKPWYNNRNTTVISSSARVIIRNIRVRSFIWPQAKLMFRVVRKHPPRVLFNHSTDSHCRVLQLMKSASRGSSATLINQTISPQSIRVHPKNESRIWIRCRRHHQT